MSTWAWYMDPSAHQRPSKTHCQFCKGHATGDCRAQRRLLHDTVAGPHADSTGDMHSKQAKDKPKHGPSVRGMPHRVPRAQRPTVHPHTATNPFVLMAPWLSGRTPSGSVTVTVTTTNPSVQAVWSSLQPSPSAVHLEPLPLSVRCPKLRSNASHFDQQQQPLHVHRLPSATCENHQCFCPASASMSLHVRPTPNPSPSNTRDRNADVRLPSSTPPSRLAPHSPTVTKSPIVITEGHALPLERLTTLWPSPLQSRRTAQQHTSAEADTPGHASHPAFPSPSFLCCGLTSAGVSTTALPETPPPEAAPNLNPCPWPCSTNRSLPPLVDTASLPSAPPTLTTGPDASFSDAAAPLSPSACGAGRRLLVQIKDTQSRVLLIMCVRP